MKLHPSQRSKLAEAICRQWIRKRRIRLAAPKVFVIFRQPSRSRSADTVTGVCYGYRRMITMHIGVESQPADWIVLLAHEFAHYLEYWTSRPRWRRKNLPHGERFQRLFWATLSPVQWGRASHGHWVQGSSAHRVKYRPDIEDALKENEERRTA